MTGVHWLDGYAEWLQRICPEILDGVPLYLRVESEIDAEHRMHGAFAWTACDCDLRLKPQLEVHGQWLGRGPAVVLSDRWYARPECERLATLIHEFAHVVDDGKSWLEDESTFSLIRKFCTLPGGQEFYLKALQTTSKAIVDHDAIQRRHHGPKFTRAALHLWWRARHNVRLEDCIIFSNAYGCNEQVKAVAALDDELTQGGDLTTVLKSPMPEKFAALFQTK